MKIKDNFINDLIYEQLKGYRKVISELGDRLDFFNGESLRDFLRDKDSEIDFIKFCSSHIEKSEKEGREGTAHNHQVVRNSLVDYFNRHAVSITEINSNMLISYEKFLRGERTMLRDNGQDGTNKRISRGLSDSGLHNHMRDLRTLFNAARNLYNNEDLGIYRIKHYPFKKYKVGSPPLTKKRNNSLEQVRTFRDCVTIPHSRSELAKDLYMLSFYLCGRNAVDLYHLKRCDIRNGRIDYNRSKMYFSLNSNFEINGFYLPSFLRGAAFSILYISIALYSTRYADPQIILKIAGTMIIFRSFIGTGVFTGVYNYFIYAQRIRHLDIIASNTDAGTNGLYSSRMTDLQSKLLLQQASLSALKELNGLLVICGIIILVLISAYFIWQYSRSELKKN